ncbi:hypothetical protein FACS1894182_04770 [Bacteroidia bacterium]|nr:hypothetical protein FACS1894182_04770 [Bacteroidia bacterium]
MALASIAILASCAQDGEPFIPTGDALQINVSMAGFTSGSPETRTTDAGYTTSFATGDQIGVTVILNGEIRHNNLPYKYNGTRWNPVADPAGIYTGVTYLIYYPYSAAMNGKTSVADIVAAFTPKTDQSAPADYAASDLLTGTSSLSGGSILSITLTHALALVEVSLPASATSVTLSVGGTSVTPYVNGNVYRYIAKPQTGVTLSGGHSYLGETLAWEKTGVTLTAGKYTGVDVKSPIISKTINGIEAVAIPKGTFMMGSPSTEPNRYSDETQHQVTLTKDFYMSKYQVTNAQYAAFLNANNIGSDGKWASGSYPSQRLVSASSGSYNWGLNWDSGNSKWVPASGYDNHPVIYVTWYGADEYARWAGGSLPTEAQWEYACRGDYPNKATEVNTLPFGIGTGRKLTGDMANFRATYPYDLDNTSPGSYNDASQSSLYKGGTTAVGSYPYANNYGLYDMHGNVFEWCGDWYGSNYGSDPVTDPKGSATGSYRVLRGGYWNYDAQICRSAYRNDDFPDYASSSYIGFRVVFVP